MSNPENYEHINNIAKNDVATLIQKGKTYGPSWKQRGGVGAFMMLARKWDRIENMVRSCSWDIFEAAKKNPGLLEELQDLRCYLLLNQSEIELTRNRAIELGLLEQEYALHPSDSSNLGEEPGPGYVNQG